MMIAILSIGVVNFLRIMIQCPLKWCRLQLLLLLLVAALIYFSFFFSSNRMDASTSEQQP
jgi:hypothetical protein